MYANKHVALGGCWSGKISKTFLYKKMNIGMLVGLPMCGTTVHMSTFTFYIFASALSLVCLFKCASLWLQ